MRTGMDQRRHRRFALEPMYAPVAVRRLDRDSFDIEGHAYDISEGGMRFEADQAIAPGTPVALQITLPALASGDPGPGRSVFVFGNIVWLEDEDEPGPVRTAAVFTHFARAGDRERLLRCFASGALRAAA